ncbi:WecB/TagA/CpsF family glycosyltransferase [Opitutales bacterium]|nr:WecB/TagA/CpsF family glycosyltransferase [Opitutales bacterium]
MQIGKLDIIDAPRDAVVQTLVQAAQSRDGETRSACFCEAHLFVRAHREAAVLSALHSADFVFPDGTSLILGARVMRHKLQQRHPGPAVMLELCEAGQTAGLKHYFYGGREGVGERLSDKLQQLYPEIQIVGHESPPFRELTAAEDLAVKQRIEASGADILWVGLGAPKQELWMQQHREQIDVPLMMAVGAAFEYFSGDQKWAPAWMRKYGLEWFYRMTTGGPRLFKRYLKYVPLFGYVMAREAISQRLKRRPNKLMETDRPTRLPKP